MNNEQKTTSTQEHKEILEQLKLANKKIDDVEKKISYIKSKQPRSPIYAGDGFRF